jgi:PadR family transcriptional regulator PadR
MKMTRTTIAVLQAFMEAGPKHALYGLEIMRSASIMSGTLYPILDRLEDAGWVTAEWEQVDDDVTRPRRRYYKITAEGSSAVHALAKQRPALRAKFA